MAAMFVARPGSQCQKRIERYQDAEWRKRAVEELKSTPLPTRWENFELAESDVVHSMALESAFQRAELVGEVTVRGSASKSVNRWIR